MTDRQKDETYQVYWDAIRRRVCSVCLDQADDGSCGLFEPSISRDEG